MSSNETETTECPKCYQSVAIGMRFCPSCGEKLQESKAREEGQDLQKPLGCVVYTIIGMIAPVLPFVIVYFVYLLNILNETALEVLGALLSLFVYPTIWYYAAKGRYNKVNFFGYVNLFVCSFIPFGNWWVVYYLGKGLYMTSTKQEIRNPPKATGIGFVTLIIGAALLAMYVIFSSSSSSPSVYQPPIPMPITEQRSTDTPRPRRQPTATPFATKQPKINYHNLNCIPWTRVDETDIDSQICIYGSVYSYGQYSNKWNTIQFSSASDAFRMVDFNFFYTSPLNYGDCVIVYGKVRDYGPYLIITPDKDAEDSIQTISPSSSCK